LRWFLPPEDCPPEKFEPPLKFRGVELFDDAREVEFMLGDEKFLVGAENVVLGAENVFGWTEAVFGALKDCDGTLIDD
jgi:hypothetical protein